MLTVFSVPRPFVGESAIIQRNAIRSWTRLPPGVEVILLGDDEGTAEIARELGLRHLPEVARNEFGTPLLHSVFVAAEAAARHDILCYVNADIVLLSDFAAVVPYVADGASVVLGRRVDVPMPSLLDFDDPGWEAKLRAYVEVRGVMHSHDGIDYFMFPRSFWEDIPPFAIGRTAWDNWLVAEARRLARRTIDASFVVTAIHQNHAAGPIGTAGRWNRQHPEVRRNLVLAGEGAYFDLLDCTHVLRGGFCWRALSPRHLERQIQRASSRSAKPGLKRMLAGGALRAQSLYHRLRPQRRKFAEVSRS